MAMGKKAQGKTRGRARSVARDLKAGTTSVRGGAAAVSELSVIVYNGHAGLGANGIVTDNKDPDRLTRRPFVLSTP
jgi:hypothetical protein